MADENEPDAPKEPAAGEEKGEEQPDGARRSTSSRLWTPYSEPEGRRAAPDGQAAPPRGAPAAEEVDEEEMRRRIEEALEKLTVTDVILDMAISLTSLAWQKMGIPREVNEKYRDMEQAKMAIDSLDALVKVLEQNLSPDEIKPLVGALDALKINYANEL